MRQAENNCLTQDQARTDRTFRRMSKNFHHWGNRIQSSRVNPADLALPHLQPAKSERIMIFRQARVHYLVAIFLVSIAPLAGAATKTSSFAVTATVVANCFINSASAMTFGNYTPGTGNVDQTSSIVVRCSNTTTYGIGLDAGTGVGSTLGQRTMSIGVGGTNNVVNYNLYTDSGRTILWANPITAATAAGNQGGTGSGLANTATHTVYGRLADDATSQAATPSALYTSTVTLTINY